MKGHSELLERGDKGVEGRGVKDVNVDQKGLHGIACCRIIAFRVRNWSRKC